MPSRDINTNGHIGHIEHIEHNSPTAQKVLTVNKLLSKVSDALNTTASAGVKNKANIGTAARAKPNQVKARNTDAKTATNQMANSSAIPISAAIANIGGHSRVI